MYYYAGVVDFDRNKKTKDVLIDMFSADNKENCYVFDESFISLAYKLPGQNHPSLDVPRFFRPNKNIALIVEGSIDNIDELDPAGDLGRSIANLYDRSGIEFISKLVGNFSLVIYDLVSAKTFLYRSRVGLNPLYYSILGKKIIFSSLIKPLACSLDEKRINKLFLASYFFLDGLNIGDSTEYENIFNLMPGNLLIFDKKGKETHDFSFFKDRSPSQNRSVKEYCDIFENNFSQAIRNNTKNKDNCVIAFSGGSDTGFILGVLKEMKKNIFTKTVNFKTISRKNLDYEEAAKRAKDFKVKHLNVKIDAKKFLEIYKEIIPSLDRLTNLNLINSLLIFKLISKPGDVVFSGDGAEEQLGFYQYHGLAFNFDRMTSDLPLGDIENISKEIIPSIFNSFFCRSWEWKNRVEVDGYLKSLFCESFLENFDEKELYEIFLSCMDCSMNTNVTFRKNSQYPSLFNKILKIDFINNLVPNKGMTADLAARLFDIKIAVPFAGENLVDSLMRVPAFLKTKDTNYVNSKYLERLVARKYIGENRAFAKLKAGSDIPFTEWLLFPEFEKFVKETLSPARIEKIKIFKVDYIELIIKEHYDNRELIVLDSICIKKGKDHTHKILKLLGFVLWWENQFN